MSARRIATWAATARNLPVGIASPDKVSQRARACQGLTPQIPSGGMRPGQFNSQRELMTRQLYDVMVI